MKLHGLLLQWHSGGGEQRRHDGRIAGATRNIRWCSDGLESCDVHVAFALDCCESRADGLRRHHWWNHRRGRAQPDGHHRRAPLRTSEPTAHHDRVVDRQWQLLYRSRYRRFAREIGLVPRTTSIESPQSHGMDEAFVCTLKHDYDRISARSDARTVIDQLPIWLDHHNNLHPHRAGL